MAQAWREVRRIEICEGMPDSLSNLGRWLRPTLQFPAVQPNYDPARRIVGEFVLVLPHIFEASRAEATTQLLFDLPREGLLVSLPALGLATRQYQNGTGRTTHKEYMGVTHRYQADLDHLANVYRNMLSCGSLC